MSPSPAVGGTQRVARIWPSEILRMLSVEKVIPKLLAKVHEIYPDFRDRWNEHLQYWGDQERGLYTDMMEFAHYLVDTAVSGRTHGFGPIFELVEKLIVEGDEEAKGLLVVGLIETLQTASPNRKTSDLLRRHLGIHSLLGWLEVEKQWEGKRNLADVIREEKRKSSGK